MDAKITVHRMETRMKPELIIKFSAPGSALFDLIPSDENEIIYAEQLLAVASKLEYIGKQMLVDQRNEALARESKKPKLAKVR